jgi:hypothetical protein
MLRFRLNTGRVAAKIANTLELNRPRGKFKCKRKKARDTCLSVIGV